VLQSPCLSPCHCFSLKTYQQFVTACSCRLFSYWLTLFVLDTACRTFKWLSSLLVHCFCSLPHLFFDKYFTCLILFCFAFINVTPVLVVHDMLVLVDCVLATLCGQNSASSFAANESRDSAAQVELVHGACRKRPRKADFSLRRRCHSYDDISAWVCVQLAILLLDVSCSPTAA